MSNTTEILLSWGMNKDNQSMYRKHILELDSYFKTIGLKLRKDSELIKHYVQGTGTHTLEDIGNIMIEMKFFYDKTTYRERLKQNRRQFFNDELEDYDEEYIENRKDTTKFDFIFDNQPYISPEQEEQLREQTKNEVLLEYLKYHPLDTLPSSLKVRYNKALPKEI